MARLLIDFLRLDRGDPVAFDLNPNVVMRSPTISQGSPPASISAKSRPDGMFDRLIVADGRAKIVDLSTAPSGVFLTISQEIGFFREAARRSIEPVILYAADPHRVA